jgi:hypothetical protein
MAAGRAVFLEGSVNSNTPQVPVETATQGLFGVLARLTWIGLGNAALIFLAVFIMKSNSFSIYDTAFGGTVAGLVIIRYVDIAFLNGQTMENKPASVKDWGGYVLRLLVIGAALWGAAHLGARFTH